MKNLVMDLETYKSAHLEGLGVALRKFKTGGAATDFDKIIGVVRTTQERLATIAKDPGLTPLGASREMGKAAREGREAVAKFKAEKTAWRDRQLAFMGAELMAKAPTSKATDRQIDNVLARLRDFNPLQIQIFYNSASDEEKMLIEAASASIGRMPVKDSNGGLVWQHLLQPETVAASVRARAEAADPDRAAELHDMELLGAAFSTFAGAADRLLRESVPDEPLDADPDAGGHSKDKPFVKPESFVVSWSEQAGSTRRR